jgi:hypothetical protein
LDVLGVFRVAMRAPLLQEGRAASQQCRCQGSSSTQPAPRGARRRDDLPTAVGSAGGGCTQRRVRRQRLAAEAAGASFAASVTQPPPIAR